VRTPRHPPRRIDVIHACIHTLLSTIEMFILRNKPLSTGETKDAIRQGKVPYMTKYYHTRKNIFPTEKEKLLLILDAFRNEEHQALQDIHVLEALFGYIYLTSTSIYNWNFLSEIHIQYLIVLCRQNLNNIYVVACMLWIILCNLGRSPKDLIYEFLIQLTLYHQKNPTCWASTLAMVWNKFIFNTRLVTSLCEDQDFAEAFMNLVQCKIEKIYRNRNSLPDVMLCYLRWPQPEEYCLEILYGRLFAVSTCAEQVKLYTVVIQYIPYMYNDQGILQPCATIIERFTSEMETKTAKNTSR
jgi:hypothetical protein